MIVSAVTVVVMSVVVAAGVGIIVQCSGSKRLRCFIRRTLNAGIQFDPHVRQRHLSAAANTAADQCIDLGSLKESRQRAMTASVRVNNLFSHNFTVFHVIQLKLRGVSEVLEDLSVFIGNCDSHCVVSFLHDGLV